MGVALRGSFCANFQEGLAAASCDAAFVAPLGMAGFSDASSVVAVSAFDAVRVTILWGNLGKKEAKKTNETTVATTLGPRCQLRYFHIKNPPTV